ncbi:CHAT domain protein [Micromonospora sp. MW-13]|uniref:CHAT domain-containing protein n=1 Tax=Micromonospora sp. MW-13 TaxID=2094022 RepID=UPI000E439818|nr:CHAT domain-containing protein [Micromonospora sp. MW-13]RGC66922.1 CHAT domain protein [Micromonospora sp. MW-13]
MLIDELTWLVADRVTDHQHGGGPKPLFSAGAERDATALWRLLRTIDPETASAGVEARVARASLKLGWFHYHRWRHAPDGGGHVDLARSLLCVDQVADDVRAVPVELRPMVGRFTEPGEQADAAVALLDAAAADHEPALLDAAILLMEPAAARMPQRDPRRAGLLARLCRALRRRHERDGSACDLDQAIAWGEQATALARRDGGPPTALEADLARAYRCRHRLRADPADLRQVIDLLTRATTRDGRDAALLSELSAAHRQRYGQDDEPADLEQAVTLAERAAALPGGRASTGVLVNLGDALLCRYERSGNRADLWRAADLAEQVVARVPDDDPLRSVYLAGAAAILLRRHERSHELLDLRRAVELNEEALALLEDEHPRRPDVLRCLAAGLHQRYRRLGADADLSRALTLLGWALAAIPADRPDRAQVSMEIVAVRLTRHLHTGVLAELAAAIELGEQVTAGAPACPPEWASVLGQAYQLRNRVSHELADLDRAIDLGERSLAGTGADDVALAARQARVAAAYLRRHAQRPGRTDLDRAIDLGERAVALTPDDHLDLPERLSDLAAARLTRYRFARSPADVEAAVALAERALAVAPGGHPGRSRLVALLCAAGQERAGGGGRGLDGARLRELAGEVREAASAAPVDRVAAHHAVGVLAQTVGEPRLAVRMLDAAAAFLPSVAPREAGWADQQHRLGEHFGLVGAGVAAHCVIDDPAGAVEFAERGRGVLLASQASTRVDLDGLRQRDPRLAARFQWVCERLNTPGFPAGERQRWWSAYDGLLAEIGALPGLDGFLAAPRLVDLRPAVAGGYGVLVNASRHRSDAVIVPADADPILVELPDLRMVDVVARVDTLLAAVSAGPSLAATLRRRQVVSDVLSWLWDTVVARVVRALPDRPTGGHRVWWLPTGLLGLLPLHAAGRPGQPGALDALVSSYVPSLRTLREARDRPPAGSRRHLTVAMQRTPGQAELPGALDEATVLDGPTLLNDEATTDRVLAALTEATWTHFACHAVVEASSQADSGLLLHDATLRLPDIGGLRLPRAELAYLSACSTANHGSRYADEVLHLASAFHLAGFRHVVASLWPLVDQVAVQAARSFYRRLPDTPTADAAADALHQVTLELRDEHPDSPELWALLVHSGP